MASRIRKVDADDAVEILRNAQRWLTQSHRTVFMPTIYQKDIGDYGALRILSALEELVRYV